MSYEVKATSRNYEPTAYPHMSIKGGPFGQVRGSGRLTPPLTPDRSGRRTRGTKLSAASSRQLSGRPRLII